MNPKADDLLRSAAAAQTAQKLTAEASDSRSRPQFTATKKAADEMAAALKRNIEACYEHTKADCHLQWCEDTPWSEEYLRRRNVEQIARANMTTTHIDCITALENYEKAVKIDELADSLRETVELTNKMKTKMDDVFGAIEDKFKGKGAPFDEPLPTPVTVSQDKSPAFDAPTTADD
jgi:hypothetical protein